MSGEPQFKAPSRIIQDREGWEVLRRQKLGPCRLCSSASFRVQLHHLVPRGRAGLAGGDDIGFNLVPLCPECHEKVEARRADARVRLRAVLEEPELAYIIGKRGLEWLNTQYPAGPELRTFACADPETAWIEQVREESA